MGLLSLTKMHLCNTDQSRVQQRSIKKH